MKRLLLLILLVGCEGNLGTNGLQPRVYDAALQINQVELNVTFQFTRSPDETTTVCNSKGMRKPPQGAYTTGCAIRPQSKYNNTDRWLIVAVKPTGWNDFPSLANLGHEVLHGLGGEHE